MLSSLKNIIFWFGLMIILGYCYLWFTNSIRIEDYKDQKVVIVVIQYGKPENPNH